MKGYKLTTEKFINLCKEIHFNKYDYSLVNYISSKKNVNIICLKHGIFSQRASNHLLGQGCKKCTKKMPISLPFTTIEFISKANDVHNYKYDYSLVNYVNSHKKVRIKCKNNHIFDQRPSDHLDGHGCRFCSNNFKMDTNCFIEKANKVHNNLYDYSLVNYDYNSLKIKIICKKHGIFEQRANNHISLKRGCPYCKISKNEILINKLLEENNIKFETQKKFNNCKFKYKLAFDFYLIDFNICIEYDGKQHYEDIYNCEEEFQNIQLRDNIKTEFCKNNNIELLRIKYDENTELKINSFLKKLIAMKKLNTS